MVYMDLDVYNNSVYHGNGVQTPPPIVYEWADMANALLVQHMDGWEIDSPFCDMPERMTTEELIAFCKENLEEMRKVNASNA